MRDHAYLFWILTATLLLPAVALGGVFYYLTFASAVIAVLLMFDSED